MIKKIWLECLIVGRKTKIQGGTDTAIQLQLFNENKEMISTLCAIVINGKTHISLHDKQKNLIGQIID